MVFLTVSRNHCGTAEQQILFFFKTIVILPIGCCCTRKLSIAEPPALIFLLQLHIHDLFLLPLDAGELSGFRFLVNDLDLVHDFGWKVVESRLIVTKKERPATDRDLAHFLAVDLDRSVLTNLHARHLLK